MGCILNDNTQQHLLMKYRIIIAPHQDVPPRRIGNVKLGLAQHRIGNRMSDFTISQIVQGMLCPADGLQVAFALYAMHPIQA